MKVVIVGSGNVATALGKKIAGSGHEIIQVAARNAENAAALASSFGAAYTANLMEISKEGDFYLVAVSDGAIEAVASNLKLNNQIVVHTAASVSKEVLKHCSHNYGVLYPLQTFRKEISVVPPIPVFLDANNNDTLMRLQCFAAPWAASVAVGTDEQRSKLHLAAVLVNNFINHLLGLSELYCNSNGLDFKDLKPLIEETVERGMKQSPTTVQTGPAVRNDFATIEKHRRMLQDHPDLLNIYNTLTASIESYYNKSKI